MDVRLGVEKQRYTTCTVRGSFPVGTECWAHRDPVTDDLHLTFDDGTVEVLDGTVHFAKGIESSSRVYISAEQDIIMSLAEDVKAEIDREVLKEIFDTSFLSSDDTYRHDQDNTSTVA